MIRQAWLAIAAERLAEAGVSDAMRDARLLLRWVLDVRPEDLHEALREEGTAEEHTAFEAAIAQRAGRVPLSHITGTRLFWGRRFRVNNHVLDPRPETETLVAEAQHRGPFRNVLDLGTGSGCLLVTLLAEWPDAQGIGVDISPDALKVARVNAENNGVAGRAQFVESNWVDGVSDRFDLIVSNPPYLAEAEISEVSPEVRDHEPLGALVSGPEGLEAYRAIASDAGRVLAPGGILMLELGATQAEPVAAVLAGAGWNVRALIPDLDHRPRVIVAAK